MKMIMKWKYYVNEYENEERNDNGKVMKNSNNVKSREELIWSNEKYYIETIIQTNEMNIINEIVIMNMKY